MLTSRRSASITTSAIASNSTAGARDRRVAAGIPRWSEPAGRRTMLDFGAARPHLRHGAHRRARDRVRGRRPAPTPSSPGATCCSSRSPRPLLPARRVGARRRHVRTDYSGYPIAATTRSRRCRSRSARPRSADDAFETPLMWLDKTPPGPHARPRRHAARRADRRGEPQLLPRRPDHHHPGAMAAARCRPTRLRSKH